MSSLFRLQPAWQPVEQAKSRNSNESWRCRVFDVTEDARGKRLTRTITSFRQVGDLYRRDHEIHQLQLLDRAEVRARLRAVGLRVCTLAGYGAMPFPRDYVGFLARKP